MKKVFNISCICIAIIILISSLMTGCSSKSNKINTEQSSASYVENEDFQYFIDSSSAIAKADNGYYFLNSLKLYFLILPQKKHILFAISLTVSILQVNVRHSFLLLIIILSNYHTSTTSYMYSVGKKKAVICGIITYMRCRLIILKGKNRHIYLTAQTQALFRL